MLQIMYHETVIVPLGTHRKQELNDVRVCFCSLLDAMFATVNTYPRVLLISLYDL
ncbi:hypothetical protein J6590_089540 [Homalodisca vitripennis]|nr:hypothetical protein J6590_089540 [Homalodisca vitripennis]